METLGKQKRKRVPWPCVLTLLCDRPKECKVTGSVTNRLQSIECSECSGWVSYWLAARRGSAAQLRHGPRRPPWSRCRPIHRPPRQMPLIGSNRPSYGVSRYVSVNISSWSQTAAVSLTLALYVSGRGYCVAARQDWFSRRLLFTCGN